MTQQVPNEKELLEILEIAKIGERKMKEVSEGLTTLSEKCQRWHETELAKKQKQVQ